MSSWDDRCQVETYFLLPFSFGFRDDPDGYRVSEARDAVIRALKHAGDRHDLWRLHPAEGVEGKLLRERTYLHPFAFRAVTAQRYLDTGPRPWASRDDEACSLKLRWATTDGAPEPIPGWSFHGAHLHLFDIGAGVLAIELHGDTTLRHAVRVHEAFRVLFPRFPGQRVSLEIGWGNDQPDPAALFAPSMDRGDVEERIDHRMVRDLLGPLLRSDADGGDLVIRHAADARMYVHSWVATDGAAWEDPAIWSRLVWVDTDSPYGSWSDQGFGLDLHDHCDYRRWWPEHRIGFTRYSTVFAGPSVPGGFYASDVRGHVGSLYYTMAVLHVLLQRQILSLSDRSARLAADIAAGRPVSEVAPRVDALRATFLLFLTRYWFPEVSHEEQGLDMSRRWSDVLGLPRLFEELRAEVDGFQAWQQAEVEERFQRTLAFMSVVIGVVGTWVGILGADADKLGLTEDTYWLFALGSLLFCAVAGFGMWWALSVWLDRPPRR